MTGPIYIDDVDLSTEGFRVVRSTGFEDSFPGEVPTMSVPALERDIEASTFAVPKPRAVSLRLRFRTSDAAAMHTAMDRLRARVLGREVRLRHSQRDAQELVARCRGLPVDVGRIRWVSPFQWEPTLEFVCRDPAYRDRTAQEISFTTTAASLPMGTGSSRLVLRITATGGSVVNPRFIYESSTAATLADITMTLTVANGDAVELDGETGAVRKRVSGVWSNARDTVPLGTVFPQLLPSHGDFLTSAYPTIKGAATSGGANIVGLATYRRRWE
jgi:hypothetical protein